MAKKFLTPIDLNQLELQNARLQNLATAPDNPVVGQMYYNTTSNKALVWDGTSWVPWEVGGVTGVKGNSENAYRTGNVNLTAANIGAAASSHSHGNITSGGDITATAPTIANNDQIVINDDSASKITNGPVFDGSTTTTALTPKGTWETFSKFSGSYADLTNKPLYYGVCSTAASTTAKTASISNYTLATGSWAAIKFTVTNTGAVANLTLNINSTGAKPIKYRGGNLPSTVTIMENRVYMFVYDGTNYELVGDLDTNTTYSGGTTDELTAGEVTTNRVWQPKILHDYISSSIGASDAMRFKGTLGTGGTVTSLPTTGVKVGDTYRVITAGTYASVVCEVGDLVIATATTPTWTVAQTNIDGAVTASTTTTSGYLAKFTGNKVVANGPQLGSSTSTYLRNDGTWATPPGTYSLPVAASNTRGGVKIGYTQSGKNYPVQLSDEKMYVYVPWENTTYSNATSSTAGLMSAADKQTFDAMAGLALGWTTVTFTPTANSLSKTVNGKVFAYTARDATTIEEVVIDSKYTASTDKTQFSVAAAYSNGIVIDYICKVSDIPTT